jgi:hypothetical protein
MTKKYEFYWLAKLLVNCKFKLTSKDKLVASYLILPKEDCGARRYSAVSISELSGLSLRTVHKSVGRLEAIGAISFLTDNHYALEDI